MCLDFCMCDVVVDSGWWEYITVIYVYGWVTVLYLVFFEFCDYVVLYELYTGIMEIVSRVFVL